MDKIINYLKDRYKIWGWVGQRAHDAVGINEILGLDFIICCDHGIETEYYFKKKLISLEKLGHNRLFWSNEDLDNNFKDELLNEFIEFLSDSNDVLNILCYRSIKKLQEIQKKFPDKLKIYAVPNQLKEYFDDKVNFRGKIPSLNLKSIPGKTISLDASRFNEFKKDLNLPFIVQFPHGSSGINTYTVTTEEDYSSLCNRCSGVKVNVLKFMQGYSLNVNGVVVKGNNGIEVYSTYPSIQLVGLKECSNSPTVFCGNDYTTSRDLDEIIIEKVKVVIEEVGRWMGQNGYRGIFGMDMIVENQEVYPVEINPRFQNSTGLLAISEIINNSKIPLFLLHILEFLKKDDKYLYELSSELSYQELMQKQTGSQVILHNYQFQATVIGELLAGIYEYKNDNLFFKKKASSLLESENDNDILITCGVPSKGKIIAPLAPICKIQTKTGVLSSDYKNLNSNMSKVVKVIYEILNLQNIDLCKMKL